MQLDLSLSFDSILCNASTTTITSQTSGGVTPYSYDWDNDGFDDGQALTNALADQYTLVIQDFNGCTLSQTILIPDPDELILTTTTSDEIFGNDGSIDLSVVGGFAPYSYLWSSNDSIEDLDSLVAGLYSVNVTDANGCEKSLNVVVGSQVSIIENHQLTFKVYPNPVGDYLIIDPAFAGKYDLVIYNIFGSLINTYSEFQSKQNIDVSNLSNGIYFVEAISGDSKERLKVVISR